MSPVEVRFLSPGWRAEGVSEDRPVNDTELVDRGSIRHFEKEEVLHLLVSCGTSIIGWERMREKEKHLDDGAWIHFSDWRSKLEVSEGKSIRLDIDLEHRDFAHAAAEIEEGGFAKLTIEGEVIAEIKHIPTP